VTVPKNRHILTINSGSSSIKSSLYHIAAAEELELFGSLERIGLDAGLFVVQQSDGKVLTDQHCHFPDHSAALKTLLAWLDGRQEDHGIDAVGHRIVHGGRWYQKPELATPQLIATLKTLIPFAPLHLPHEIAAMEAISRHFPSLPQAACFDTAFHRSLPPEAQHFPLPRRLTQEGIVRYGFHGLSYEYILQEIARENGAEAAQGRIIIAHLGNGASMAAIYQGKSMDTTMGFTPTGGLMMSTRTGDLDPGVIFYLLEEKSMEPSAVNELMNRHSGLVGVSGSSPDVEDLLAKEAHDPHAAEALELFCYRARKFVGALSAALGGLDMLVFTAGIGENAAVIRSRICEKLEFLGINLDPARNTSNAPVISPDGSAVTVRVMKTNEALMIARQTNKLLDDAR
jgi:acetate kinase